MGAPHGTPWQGAPPGRGTEGVSPSVTLCPCCRVNLALAYTELTEELCRLRNLSSLQSQILRALLQEKSLNGGKGGPWGLHPTAGRGWEAKNGGTTLAAVILRPVLSSCGEHPAQGASLPGSIPLSVRDAHS